MSMNQIPTLVLGAGGVGCRIAASLSDSLSPEDRKYVSVIGIDTDINEIARLKGSHSHIEFIQTSDDREVSEYLEEHPEYNEWFPENSFLRERTMTDGAGQIRTLSRLAFLESVEKGRFDPISKEITRIRRVDSNPHSGNLVVVIIGSISGGTGAGLFINLPFYIRHLVSTEAGINRLTIRGLFVGPDIMKGVQRSKTNEKAVCVNAYACLKELNAFYMRPALGTTVESNLRLEYYDHTNAAGRNVPYDYLYLFEKTGVNGTMGEATLADIQKYIAQIAFVLLFSPINPSAISIEDNFALQLIGDRGMNRYAGAGMCRLQYPIDTARKYVALSVVRDLVQNEWLLIDRKFAALTQEAISRMRTDRSVEKPDIRTSYVELFEQEALGDNANLGMLAREAYVEKDHKFVTRGAEFVENMNNLIGELVDSEEVKQKEEACKIDEQKMKKISEATAQVESVWEGMKEYTKYAKQLIKTKAGGMAETLFPATDVVMKAQKDDKKCVYNYLATVHPVTARFLIYDIMNRLEKIMTEARRDITGVVLNAYDEEDFDPKTEGVQSPQSRLTSIQDRYPGFMKSVFKALGPVGDAVSGEERALLRLKKKLGEVCEVHISTTRDFLENSLKYEICRILYDRFDQLADNYAVFFNAIAEKIERNNTDIARLENIEFPYGHEGIYCSKQALKTMASQYYVRESKELPKETKEAIFNEIFLVQSRAFEAGTVAETEKEIQRRAKDNKRRLELVFNTAVVKTITSGVDKHGAGIVNLTAREALRKEFEMKSGMLSDDEGYDEALKAYVQSRISDAFRIAAPMIAVDQKRESARLVFLAISPECAETDANLDPDEGQTARFYISNMDALSQVIINDEFDDTDIVCVDLAYNFVIENLVRYKKNSSITEEYEDRIDNLNTKRSFDISEEELLITVNPHLNANWNQEGFIPDIDGEKRAADRADTRKAFVYAMGLDSFEMILDDERPDKNGKPRPTWYYCSNGCAHRDPVKKCGELIGNGYFDLFDALSYNRAIKKSILQDARRTVKAMKGYASTEELFEEILENRLFVDLIQPNGDSDPDDKNIVDIFMEMRTQMPERTLESLFDGLLKTLWEICGVMFDGNAVYINKAVRTVLKAIFDGSALKKAPQKLSNREKSILEAQFDALLSREYEKN